MSAKHTPGPWVAVDGIVSGRDVIAPDAPKTRRRVAQVGGQHRDANARLIAAAPELLEELQRARRVLVAEGYIPATTMDAAIAKATGDAQ